MTETAAVLAPDVWEGRFWLPRGPLASNDPEYEGIFRHSREVARTMRFVEANPKALVSQIVIDIDKPDALLRAHALQGRGIVPNLFAHSRRPGRGHAVILLRDLVPKTDAANLGPIRLLARCQSGLTRAYNGDRNYTGPLTRNPLHVDARTIWGRAEPYGLRELAHGLSLDGFLPAYAGETVEDAIDAELGRNCWLFTVVRRWANRAWTRYPRYEDWLEAVHAYTWARNAALVLHPHGPLAHSEVASTARSVAAYVWKSDNRRKGAQRFEADFKEIQARRGRTMTEKRRTAITAANKRRSIDRAAMLAALEE
jgi:hypothetical protein